MTQSSLDKILELVFTARMAVAQPSMDGMSTQRALDMLDEMVRLCAPAYSELVGLREENALLRSLVDTPDIKFPSGHYPMGSITPDGKLVTAKR